MLWDIFGLIVLCCACYFIGRTRGYEQARDTFS